MVVTFGIEGISHFGNARKNVQWVEKPEERYSGLVFEVCDDLDKGLRKYYHTKKFYYAETDCGETDIRDITFNGADNQFADDVDLFFISTHGGNDEGIIQLVYNNKVSDWVSDSNVWRLGDKKLKWLIMHACNTINLKYLKELLPIFQKLHEICGAFGTMHTGLTTDEEGEKLANNLTKHNKPVADAWIDAVDDWGTDNHPAIVAAEKRDTIDFRTGRPDWPLTTMALDHISGSVPDIPNSDIYWLSVKWVEGYTITRGKLLI